MGAVVLLLLIAGVIAVFVWLVRQRVRSNLERAGHALPEELVRMQAAATTGLKPAAARPATVGATAPAAVPRAPHFVLIYDFGPDFIQRCKPFHDEHLKLAWQAAQRGELVLGGPLEEPLEQAFLLFSGSREAALRFAAADPYVKNGLVKSFRVKQWHTTVGDKASNPIRPA